MDTDNESIIIDIIEKNNTIYIEKFLKNIKKDISFTFTVMDIYEIEKEMELKNNSEKKYISFPIKSKNLMDMEISHYKRKYNFNRSQINKYIYIDNKNKRLYLRKNINLNNDYFDRIFPNYCFGNIIEKKERIERIKKYYFSKDLKHWYKLIRN